MVDLNGAGQSVREDDVVWFQKKPGIKDISFDTLGWHQLETSKAESVWTNNPSATSALLILKFYDDDPNTSVDTSDVQAVRNMQRSYANQMGAGLIKAEVHEIQSVRVVETIIKQPGQQPGSGITYIGMLIVPFRKCWYSISVMAREVGVTGFREALLTNKLGMEQLFDIVDTGAEPELIFKHPPRDPYDPAGEYLFMPSFFEQEEFDAEFPEHPLSVVRWAVARLTPSLCFSDELLKHRV